MWHIRERDKCCKKEKKTEQDKGKLKLPIEGEERLHIK